MNLIGFFLQLFFCKHVEEILTRTMIKCIKNLKEGRIKGDIRVTLKKIDLHLKLDIILS